MFAAAAGRGIPGAEEVASLCRTIGAELDIARSDKRLHTEVARRTGKALELFAEKCASILPQEAEAFIPSDPPHPFLKRNMDVFLSLHLLSESALALCPSLHAEAVAPFQAGIGQLER